MLGSRTSEPYVWEAFQFFTPNSVVMGIGDSMLPVPWLLFKVWGCFLVSTEAKVYLLRRRFFFAL